MGMTNSKTRDVYCFISDESSSDIFHPPAALGARGVQGIMICREVMCFIGSFGSL